MRVPVVVDRGVPWLAVTAGVYAHPGDPVNCPYPDCTEKNLAQTSRCSKCERRVKRCDHCQAPNRMLAVFCRSCGRLVPDDTDQWTGFQGGPNRRGLNGAVLNGKLPDLEGIEVGRFELHGRCKDLLFYDGHLLATSDHGDLRAMDLDRPHRKAGARVQGHLSVHSCVTHGALLVGQENRLAAYTLTGLSQDPPTFRQLWDRRVDGVPTGALLGVGDHLIFNYVAGNRETGLALLTNLNSGDSELVALEEAALLSPPVALSPGERVAYFRGRKETLELCTVENDGGLGDWRTRYRQLRAPGDVSDHLHLASVGRQIYGVFAHDDRFCQFDEESARFGEFLCTDARAFAVSGVRKGVVVQTDGLYFLQHGTVESSTAMARSQPVILRDRLVAVGLSDGRFRVHDLQDPHIIEQWRVSTSPVEIVASYENFIAAGAADGSVGVWRLSSSHG